MTSPTNPTSNQNQAQQSASASSSGAATGTPTTTTTTTTTTTASARSSYATATKAKPASPTGVASHNAMSNSVSPVNGKPPVPPAVPSMAGPAIVNSSSGSSSITTNGAPTPGDHSRKPSAVTISASGTSYNMPNGSSAGPTAPRPNINFGSMNAAGSPAISNSVPHVPHNSLSAPMNPGPGRTPSPIPNPPAASGGRPPSGLQGPGTQLNFGTLPGGDGVDAGPRLPLPQGPAAQLQGQHLRRDSSQSVHSDINPSVNRAFIPNGRGQAPFRPGQPYPNQMPHSPQPQYRPNVMQQRGGQPPNIPMYQQTSRMPNSPYAGRGTPAIPGNTMQQQTHYPGMPAVPPFGYPAHPAQQFTPQGAQGMYGQPHGIPQDYAAGYPYNQPYPAQFYGGVPSYGGAPPSPRNYPPAQAPYAQGYNPQGMSRQSSNGTDRPASTGRQPSTPGVPPAQAPPTPGPGSSSPAPAQQFQQPPRKSKAIQIKRPDGTEVQLDKLASPSPAQQQQPQQPQPQQPPPQNRGPTLISSAAGTPSSSTPPPRTPSVSAPSHNRSDSQATKSAVDKNTEFREQFARQLAAESAEEQRKKQEEEKAAKEKEEQAAREKEAKEKEEADRKAKEIEEAAKAAKEKEEAEKAALEAKSKEAEAAEKKRREDEEMERWIAELEAKEREEEEAEKKYAEERKKRVEEEKARQAAEAKGPTDEDLRRQEREAEEAELAKEKATKEETDLESAKLFASLKKPTLGPGANEESGTSSPAAESPVPQPAQLALPAATLPKVAAPLGGKPKPAALKLETTKPVEPAQPTAGMQSLKSARYLDVKNLEKIYPDGVKSPNPALNATAKGRGRKYDKEFLLQFQAVFKEKPSIEWDKMLKDTVGDTSDSARPQSARTPSGAGRQNSRPPMPGAMMGGGAMGNFIGAQGRTLPPGTNSTQRFMASEHRMGGMPPNPFAFGGPPGQNFRMGPQVMTRSGSQQALAQQVGVNSPRTASSRGKGSRRGPAGPSAAEEAKLAKSMPLTAGQDLKPLEMSKSGWKPTSIGQGGVGPALPGHMAPDLVQRKVKSALNKMTPEKFEKISDDILHIAAQSKDEQDGRTLRQVIQLTFEKACDEAHWASMYARFCKRMLETMSQDIKDDGVRDKNGQPVVGGALFRKYLLNRCQEEFERGWEVNLPTKPEGQTEEAAMLSEEYYIAAAAKRRGLGLIQFIGELYKLDMLNIRIMHQCIVRLLNFEGLPDESAIESLVKLLRTVGGKMEIAPNGHSMIDTYFERIKSVMEMKGLPSRMYYMLLDTVDLRRAGWKSKDDTKGPKTIQEIREDVAAAQAAAEVERQRQNTRGGPRPPMGRGDARSFSSGGMMPPPEYPHNQLGMNDLKKLTHKTMRQTNQGPAGSLGPPSMLGSRSSSGRRGLGPLSRGAEDSGASSRTGTPPVEKKEKAAHVNAFSALEGLDASGEDPHDAHSPSPAASPQMAKSRPVAATVPEGSKDSDKA